MRVLAVVTGLLLVVAGAVLGYVSTPLSGWTIAALLLVSTGGLLVIRVRQTAP